MKPTFLFAPLRRCGEWAKSYVEYRLGDIVPGIAAAIQEGDDAKPDKPVPTPYTIPTTGWTKGAGADADPDYPYYYDIAVAGVTAADWATIDIDPGSFSAVRSCGMCPVNETLDGVIRIRAVSIPTTAISAQYTVIEGTMPE